MTISQYLSDIAEIVEKNGSLLKECENLICRLESDIDFEQGRLDGDIELPDDVKMPEECRAVCQKNIDDMSAMKGDMKKVIADVLGHNMIFTGLLVKYGKVRPSADGLAQAITQIVQENNE